MMPSQDEIKYAKEGNDQAIYLMAKAESDIRSSIKSYTKKIVTTSLAYKYLGKRFKFTASKRLNNDIQLLLDEFKTDISSKIQTRSKQCSKISQELNNYEIDELLIPAFISQFKIKGKNTQDRIDIYGERFKLSLESYIAAGVAANYTSDKIVAEYCDHLKNPNSSQLITDAIKEGGYQATDIKAKGFSYGLGITTSILVGLKLLEQDMIFRSYNFSNRTIWSQKGIKSFYVYRGSTYDCSLCDSYANGRKWNSWDAMPPYHNRCMCYSVPEDTDNFSTISSDEMRKRRTEIRDVAKKAFKGKMIVHPQLPAPINITITGIKEYLNQPHKFYAEKNELALNIRNILRNSKFIGKTPYHKDNDKILSSYIMEVNIHNEKSWLILREDTNYRINFYSITDSPIILKHIKK